MASENLYFLDEVGTQQLAEAILSKTNERIAERIVQEVNDASDHDHVPSALLLNALLKVRDQQISDNKTTIDANKTSIDEIKENVTTLKDDVTANTTGVTSATEEIVKLSDKVDAFAHLNIDVVIGAITDVQNPSTEILYLQKDDESATIWSLWIYREDSTWIRIGDTSIDLSGYWKKTDIDSIKVSIEVPDVTPIGDKDIQDIVEKVFGDTDPFGKKKYNIILDNVYGRNTGIGEYNADSSVTVKTNSTTIDSVFTNWIAVDQESMDVLESSDSKNNCITFIMPEHDVHLQAVYEARKPFGVAMAEKHKALIGFTGTEEEFEIPVTYINPDGGGFYKFESVGPFANCTNLKSIIISEGISYIQSSSFENCTNLSSVTIPDSVISIGIGAFEGCTSLVSISLPSKLSIIDNSVFSMCTSLKEVIIPEGLTAIAGSAFYNTPINSINIPEGVTTIGPWSFSMCTELSSFTFPSSVSEIGTGIFEGCTSLTSIVIPNGVTQIPMDVFKNCTGLNSIIIPSSVTYIRTGAFEGCTGLTSITLPEGLTTIDGPFKNCTALETINIPSTVSTLYYDFFKTCTSLKTININKPEGSIEGAPWMAPSTVTINWLG